MQTQPDFLFFKLHGMKLLAFDSFADAQTLPKQHGEA
jgi:hypothetical protein